MSEHLRTAKIPCKERVRKYRVHKIGVFSEKKRVSGYVQNFTFLVIIYFSLCCAFSSLYNKISGTLLANDKNKTRMYFFHFK